MNNDPEYITSLLPEKELIRASKNQVFRQLYSGYSNPEKIDLIFGEFEKRKLNLTDDLLEDTFKKHTDFLISRFLLNNPVRCFNPANLKTVIFNDEKKAKNIKNKLYRIMRFLNLDTDNIFICRVSGNSMKNLGYRSDDFVFVDASTGIRSGDIVIAQVFKKYFIKKYIKTGNDIWLLSANKSFRPVKITSGMKFEIIGKVVYHIKDITY